MAIQGFKRKIDFYDILSPAEVEDIHLATMRVMWKTGVVVHHERALEHFAEAGCRVDKANNRVYFPQQVVEAALDSCPSTITIKARDPENNLVLESGGGTHYMMAGVGNLLVDPDTWETREPTRKEFYDFIKLLDALPNVHALPPFPFFGFAKVPPVLRLIESTAAKIRNSSKAQVEGGILGNEKWNIELAKAVDADVSILVNPAPPLCYNTDAIDKLILAVEQESPFWMSSGPVAGATSPATIAGSLVTNNAENIPGLIMAQHLSAFNRPWIGSFMMAQNMVHGSPLFATVEEWLMESAFHQIWRGYKVPAYACASAWTNSKVIDYQAGYEQAISLFNAAQAGASLLALQGGFTGELAASPVKAVIDDDVAGMVGRYLRGVEVTPETIAEDVIHTVGPIPGEFLTTKHTREWWKKEQYMPRVADRTPYPQWLKQGKPTVLDHARQRMEEILVTHQVKPLAREKEQAVEDILKDAREWYRKQGFIPDDEWQLYQEDLNSPNYPYA